MSSLKAIAAVTFVLQQILEENLAIDGIDTLGASVSIDPLDQVEENLDSGDNALNLYLYMVKENDGWRNQDLISRNYAGQRVSNPYLAVDLYYVLSAHGSEDYNGELMLGYAMVAFHDNPIIGRQFIADALASEPMLANSGLSEQMEQIRISPISPNTEEISRIWTMFGAKHRPSAYYKVSVALLRKEREIRQPLPVKKSKLYVSPIINPYIQSIEAAERVDLNYLGLPIFLSDDDVIISGLGLRGDITRVVFDATEVVVVNPEYDTEITLAVPIGLQAGIHSIQVEHQILLGEPEVPHTGITSNLAAFVLSPRITNVSFANPNLTLVVEPEIQEDTKVTILLNEINFDFTLRAANEYAFSDTTTSNTNVLTVGASTVQPGTYLVRIRVNNATSPLFQDFSGPNITI